MYKYRSTAEVNDAPLVTKLDKNSAQGFHTSNYNILQFRKQGFRTFNLQYFAGSGSRVSAPLITIFCSTVQGLKWRSQTDKKWNLTVADFKNMNCYVLLQGLRWPLEDIFNPFSPKKIKVLRFLPKFYHVIIAFHRF